MNEEKPTAQEAEATKTPSQRAQDIAYTINHALACTATDFIDPYVGNLTQKYLGKRVSIGCGHDHSQDVHEHKTCKHHHHDHEHEPKSHLKHWWVGEVIGDFGAVPVTIAAQHFLPGFMHGLKKMIEPVLGKFFHRGAERATMSWAVGNGTALDSKEFSERVEMIYRHEVDHLPQALVWTASSIAINLATQRAMGNHAPFWQLAAGKAAGASISAGLVVGGRGIAPGVAEKWDNFTSEKLFLPVTRAVGGVFGVSGKDADAMVQQEQTLKSWVNKTEKEKNTLLRADNKKPPDVSTRGF